MIALIHKELDGIRPYWWAVFASLVIFTADHLFESLAGDPRSEVLAYSFEDWGFLAGLLAFSLGHSMVAAEYRDGHVEFLDGLPVHRWMVFVAKVIAAAAPLVVLVLGTAGVKLGTAWFCGTPHGLSPFPAEAMYTLRFGAMMVGFCGFGLLLSWAGGLGWGVMLIGLFTLLIFSVIVPWMRPYLFFDGMLSMSWQGSTPQHLWGPVVLWTVFGTGCTGLSGLLFLGPGRWLIDTQNWSGTLLRYSAIGCGTLVFLFFCSLAACDLVISGSERLLAPTEVTSTEHFRFLYPSGDQQRAEQLIAEAEQISATLGEQMGNPDPLILDIEMLGASRAHAGVFLGGKIRMGLNADSRDTLTHELAHAHAFALSGWKVQHQFENVRFFEEGLARHYEQRNSDAPANSSWAAACWRTGQARFDLLTEDDLRSETHDGDQAYPLGEAFVDAVVQLHGDPAVGCLLGALGELGDEDIAGMSLWVQATNACDIELDDIVRKYDDNLRSAADRLPDPLPELSARLDSDSASQLLHVYDRHDAGLPLVCRFRDDEDTPRNQFEQTNVRDGACWIPSLQLSGSSFQYQLGFRLEDSDFPVFYEWTTAAL